MNALHAAMNTTKQPKPSLVSLFAGCGGSSLGYKAAGFDIRLAVEWDAKAVAIYRRNFPNANVHHGDISKLSNVAALQQAGVKLEELDVFDGSPPCQGFSMVGKRNFSDVRNHLFEDYVRLLRAFRPKAFIMENVSGLRQGKMKLVFAEMTRALKDAGYRVSCRELNAWWYGVPQDRRRLIWVGIREDLEKMSSHPKPTIRRPQTVGDALDIEAGNIIRYEWSGIKNAQFAKGWRSLNRPSPTLMAHRPPMMMKAGDASTLRYLAISETRILQGFPAWFDIRENEYKFIGNSVPPPMAEAVGRHVLSILYKN